VDGDRRDGPALAAGAEVRRAGQDIERVGRHDLAGRKVLDAVRGRDDVRGVADRAAAELRAGRGGAAGDQRDLVGDVGDRCVVAAEDAR
jgi:hypothetical protein